MKRLANKSTGIINYSEYKKLHFKILYFILLLILFAAILASISPVLWLFITSFKTTGELYHVPYSLWPEMFDLNKVVEVWNHIDITKYFLNSLYVVIGAVLSAIIFNGLLAYVIAIVKPKGYKIVYYLVMLSYMVPAVASMVPLFKNISTLGFIDSFIPLWFVFGANAYYFIVFKNYFESIPKALFEASRIDGCSDLGIFFNIVVPLSRPIIGVIAIFASTAAWSDFLLPYLVLQDQNMYTIMVKIYSIQSTLSTSGDFGPDRLLMLLTVSIIPQIILFSIFQRQITSSVATSGMKEE